MKQLPIYLLFLLLLSSSCDDNSLELRAMYPSKDAVSYITKSDDGFQLFFHGKPFFIKGATSFSDIESLSEYGGNCLRIWDTDSTAADLDKAQDNEIAVLLVLNMLSERQGMDYGNRESVLEQRQRITEDVQKYMDHPALLMWSLGNELDLDYKNLAVWQELDTLSRMIRSYDKKHLITTSIMPKRNTLNYLEDHCPEIAIIGINSFGFAPSVENLMGGPRGWTKPYFLSEWGPRGYWEVYHTDWEAAYEATSSEKAEFMNMVYQEHIQPHSAQCMGSFAFFWGYKQERTHTWFSFFDEQGAPSEMAHQLKYLWTGQGNPTPRFDISPLSLNDIEKDQSIYLMPGQTAVAKVAVSHRDGEVTVGSWEIRKEGHYRGINGGDQEPDTSPIPNLINKSSNTMLQFVTPMEEGAYRIFYTVKDSTGTFGTANKCFFVMNTDS